MAITLENMRKLRPLIEKYNAVASRLGRPTVAQPQPLKDEIDPKGIGGNVTQYLTNPLGALSVIPGMERPSAIVKKAVIDTLPLGLGTLNQDLAMKGLQPQGVGEKVLSGGAQAASVIGQAMSIGAIPAIAGMGGIAKTIATGTAYGAQKNLIPNVKAGVEVGMDQGGLPGLISGAQDVLGKTIADAGMSAGEFAAYHGLGSLSKQASKLPYIRSVFEKLTKAKGIESANRILSMSTRAASALITGTGGATMSAGIGAMSGQPITGENLIADSIVGGVLGAAFPSGASLEKFAPRQFAVQGRKYRDAMLSKYPKAKLLTYDAKAKELRNQQVQAKTVELTNEAKQQRAAELMDLAETAGAISRGQDTITNPSESNPNLIATGWRALAERAKLLGMDSTPYTAEAARFEAMSGQYEALKPAYADLKAKRDLMSSLVDRVKQTLGEGKSKPQADKLVEATLKDYFDAEVKFNESLDSLYGKHSPEVKMSIEEYFNNPAKVADVQTSVDLINAKIGDIAKGILPPSTPIVPSNPKAPKVDVGVDPVLVKQEAAIDLDTDQAGRVVVQQVKDKDVLGQIAQGVQQIYDSIGTGQGMSSKATKADSTLDDTTRATVDTQAITLNPIALRGFGLEKLLPDSWRLSVSDVTRMLTNMLPGGVRNALYQLVKMPLEDGMVKSEVDGAKNSGKLLTELKDAGFKIDFKVKSYDQDQTLDFIKWVEGEGKVAPRKVSDLVIFQKAEPIVRKFFDYYWSKLVDWHIATGKEPPKYRKNYISWLAEYTLLNPYGHSAIELPNKFIHLSTQSPWMAKQRGKKSPTNRLDLIQTIQKYAYDVELLHNQVKPLHTLNRFRAAFNKYAADKEMEAAYLKNSPAASSDFKAAANLMQMLGDAITGATPKSAGDMFLQDIAKFTNNWAGQVVTTPITMLNQVLGAAPIVGEAGIRNTARAFWQELSNVSKSPGALVDPAQFSSVYRARMEAGKHIVLDAWAGKSAPWRITANIGKFIGAATHYVDLFMVGAAYRAGYLKARELGMPEVEARTYGDYVATITQGTYEKSLRPLFLQTHTGKVLAPLSTSAFAGANTMREAIVRDWNGLRKGKLTSTNLQAAKMFATAIALRMVTNAIIPSSGGAVQDAIYDNLYGFGTLSRFGMPGILGVVNNLAEAKTAGEVLKNITAAASPIPGSLAILNTAEFLGTLANNGIVRGKDDRILYQIDPENIVEVIRGTVFGQRRTQAFADHLAQYRKSILERYAGIGQEGLDWIEDFVTGRG